MHVTPLSRVCACALARLRTCRLAARCWSDNRSDQSCGHRNSSGSLAMLAAMRRASSLVSRLYFVAGSPAVASPVARWRRGFCYITDIASWKVSV